MYITSGSTKLSTWSVFASNTAVTTTANIDCRSKIPLQDMYPKEYTNKLLKFSLFLQALDRIIIQCNASLEILSNSKSISTFYRVYIYILILSCLTCSQVQCSHILCGIWNMKIWNSRIWNLTLYTKFEIMWIINPFTRYL